MGLADVYLAALDTLMAGEWEIIATLGSSHGTSALEALKAVETVKGRKPPYGSIPGARAMRRSSELIAYARDVLGFGPRRSDIEILIADAWPFHKARCGRLNHFVCRVMAPGRLSGLYRAARFLARGTRAMPGLKIR